MDQDRFCRHFSFVLASEIEVFPVMMKRRETGRIAFRVSVGGTSGNTKAAGEEVDENEMVKKVLDQGYAVRCSSLDRKTTGLYKPGERSVREIKRHSTLHTEIRAKLPPCVPIEERVRVAPVGAPIAIDTRNHALTGRKREPAETNTALFSRFEHVIRIGVAPGRDPRLLLDDDGRVSVYYAPFEYLNPNAKVVIVGITPGPTQMSNALGEAGRQLASGRSAEQALRTAKEYGAFSGEVFRSNLIKQLDHWGIHTWLGIDSTARLFDSHRDLVHTTSLLRYPVFVDGQKYEGNPDMLKTPLLRRHLLEHFAMEVQALRDAVFIGLGPKVWKVLEGLASEGLVDRSRIVNGVLHASPENTYRITYLTGPRTEPLPWKTNATAYDEGRTSFGHRFL